MQTAECLTEPSRLLSRVGIRKPEPVSPSLPQRVALKCADVCLRGIVAAAGNLSEARALQWAPIIGKLLRKATKRRTLRNMKLFLGCDSRTDVQWEQLWDAHTLHLGQTAMEVFVWQHLPPEEVASRVSVRGEEHFLDALRPGRGVMLWASHLGNFVSMAPCAHRLSVPGCSSGNAMPTRYLEQLLERLLARFGIHRQYIGRGLPSAAAETFRRGGFFHAFVDLSLAGKREEWVRLGPTETNVSLGPALLALRYRVPVVCVNATRLDATHHRLTFHPPMHPANSRDAKSEARRLTACALERVAEGIRQHPDQWWQWDWSPLRPARHALDSGAAPS